MIFDKVENLNNYEEIRPYVEQIKEFIARVEKEKLPTGRYELLGDKLFALVQFYKTKEFDGGKMEAHKKYADLQYIVEGNERIYVDFSDELILEEDRTPREDILFFRKRNHHGYNILSCGTFGYYAPQDAHMPCIENIEKESVKKIVFKIAVE
ncbi:MULTISPECIES: YhcH/YjgK/YiaL family protein [Clostridia]|jgi:biofilm protein TabA|uniref:YhcH/YjgK/YiaL family protein n=1 Tax=Clostridia TaxID=186801 RepID=UPI000E4E8DBD|nr:MULTISPECIES: YhcH/YjgK/YiaL family protein [Clostridia]RGH38907.1 DUF386 domain-containing protein [Firmicutes bacterium AM41-5BH]RHV05619.1 DUF386 domain-containing protein [Firmicutes bacterium OM07-11]RKQ23808.1 DUF386 family protein [Ruminococcus sp. B05]TAP32287.1 DUF386 domain-containing protein [Mediterraneibacter sp. gm002]